MPRLSLVPSLTVLALALAVAPAAAAPPKGFDAHLESVLKATGDPGMAVAIVENGKTTLAKGYGVRRLGAPEKVDAQTIFPIASTGKAITVAALAVLVDEGKIGWDDKVIDHLPGFQMYDPWVTREMTIRDLLVHRSGLGLGAGDLLFVPRTNLGRAESVRRLRYIKPATSFRSSYAYDNLLYMVAGQLIEEVTGETWEVFVRDHVLKPAGMANATSSDVDRFNTPDRAQPHGRVNGPIVGMGDMEVFNEREGLGDNAAPAGGVSTSAEDLARWLSIQLAHGKLPDGKGRLFSEAASAEMWTPQTLMPLETRPPALAVTAPQFQSYALGWEVRDYRGHKIIWHAGADIGFGAIVVLIPEKNTGFAIMANVTDGVLLKGVMYELLDHYLGYPRTDWPKVLATVKQGQVDAALKAMKAEAPSQAAAKVGPELPLSGYAGAYVDPWYGPIAITFKDGKLLIDFKQSPGMVGELEHVQYETFRTRWTDKGIEPAYVTFSLTPEGAVDRIVMKPVSPLADFSFDYQDLEFRPVPPKT